MYFLFTSKIMVPPEYNWSEGGGGGGGLLNGRFIEQLTRSSLQLMKIP